MDKRVGIITINGVYNYGNSLQNLAMIDVLEQCGCNAFTIERKKPGIKSLIKRCTGFGVAKLSLYIMTLLRPQNKYVYRREIKFLSFNKKLKIKRTKKSDLKKIAKKYDYFIAGSDQVWNFNFAFNDMSVNMLSFCEHRQKIAYAASIGMAELSFEQGQAAKKYLESFKAISVRENDAKEMLGKFIDKQIEVVLDPVFLASDSLWESIMRKPKWQSDGEYVLLYFLGDKPHDLIVLIDNFKKVYGYEVIDILDADVYSYDVGPKEFVWLVKNAACVITDSFHAAVFSMIYERPISIMPKVGRRSDMSGRFETLKDNLGLENVFNNYDPAKILSIDYSLIREKIQANRIKSLAFLKKALDTESDNE